MCRKRRRLCVYDVRIASLVPFFLFSLNYSSLNLRTANACTHAHTHTTHDKRTRRLVTFRNENFEIENVFLLLIQLNTQIPKIN